MATGTYITYVATAKKAENLMEVMNLLANTDTAAYRLFANSDTDTDFVQWETVTLRAPATNKQIESFDVSTFTYNDATKLINYCQIFTEAAKVSGSMNNAARVKLPGESDAMSGQISMKMSELVRDIEYAFVSGTQATSAAGSSSVARQLQDVFGLTTPSVAGSVQVAYDATANSGAGNIAEVDASGITEKDVNDAARKLYRNGGLTYRTSNSDVANANLIIMSDIHKQNFDEKLDRKPNTRRDVSAMDGIQGQEFTKYVTSFGKFSIVPSIYIAAEKAIVCNPSNFSRVTYVPLVTEELAKTGYNTKKFMVTELSLMHINKNASCKIELS